MSASRELRWVSSTRGDAAVLAELDHQMRQFYARPEQRAAYQQMLDSQEERPLAPDSPGDHLVREIVRSGAQSVLEVGCGNGWMYRHLLAGGFRGKYAGIEMAEYVADRNRVRHPEARWEVGSAYGIPLADGAVDVCFAFYVLEHLVYPERALEEMLRVVRPGGHCLLAFPDFGEIGFLPSQQTGFSPGGAREKWRSRRWWDAAVTLYDSRLRVRPTIRRAAARFGPFPVNTRPLCLAHPSLMWADIDAVYVASKEEVAAWATGRGFRVEFPAGREGEFARHAFLAIAKPTG